MGKTLKIKTFTAVSAVLFFVVSLGVFFSQPAQAFNAQATPIMLNRTAIAMGSPSNAANIFYDKNTSNDHYIWQNITDGCYSDISREDVASNHEAGTGGGHKWVLRASTKLGDGSCSPEKTSTLSEPTNYDEREFVVFYRDNSDVINSVKADVDNPFIKTGISRGGATAIYIEKDDMDPYACPSLIIDQDGSRDGWMYVMMRRANDDSDASKQYAALIRELAGRNFFPSGIQSGDFTDDNAICEVVPADGDDEKERVLAYYGLPGSYYNTRAGNENREQVDLDYDGANLGGFDLHTMHGMDAAGMALNGILQGGFIATGELESAGGADDGELDPVCSAGALGWIFCPLTDFISEATTSIAGILEAQLVYPPLLNSDQGDAIRAIWGAVLGIANAGLAIAFLIVIFSQATSVGLSSYGIKKILPRVVIAAILMNLSFFLCAIAIDIANIIGISIREIVGSGMDIIDRVDPASDIQHGARTAQSWTAGILGILGLGIAVWTGAIVLLFPMLLTALFAVFTAFLIIAARGVIVTLLVIVAPLAFLAWVLPNTESWFTKWRKLFTTMLLMFPLVMLIFYGSLLVSKLILVTTAGGGDDDPRIMTNIIALAVLTIPLFSLPFIMKSAGGVLDRLGVIVNNRNKGLIDRTRKASQGMYDARKDTRRMSAFGSGKLNKINPLAANTRRVATRDYRRNLHKGIADENAQEYIAQKAYNKEDPASGQRFAQRMANSSDPRYIAAVQASAKATVDKLEKESSQRREVLIRAQHDPRELLKEAQKGYVRALGGKATYTDDQGNVVVDSEKGVADDAAARAYQNILLTGGSKGVQGLAGAVKTAESQSLYTDSAGKATEISSVLRSELNSAGLKPKDNALAAWAYTDNSLENIQQSRGTYATLTDTEFVGQSPDNIRAAVASGAMTTARAQAMLDNKQLETIFSPDKREIVQNWLNTPTAGGGGGTP